jgi:hypothetical protein
VTRSSPSLLRHWVAPVCATAGGCTLFTASVTLSKRNARNGQFYTQSMTRVPDNTGTIVSTTAMRQRGTSVHLRRGSGRRVLVRFVRRSISFHEWPRRKKVFPKTDLFSAMVHDMAYSICHTKDAVCHAKHVRTASRFTIKRWNEGCSPCKRRCPQ